MLCINKITQYHMYEVFCENYRFNISNAFQWSQWFQVYNTLKQKFSKHKALWKQMHTPTGTKIIIYKILFLKKKKI